MPLVAELGDDIFGGRRALHFAYFEDRMRHGFFAIDVLAGPDGCQRGGGVHVTGRGHEDGVEILLMIVDHFSKIFEARGVGEFFKAWLGLSLVDIAEGDDLHILLLGNLLQILRPLAAHANSRDADDLAWRSPAEPEPGAGNGWNSGPSRPRPPKAISTRGRPGHP